MTIDLGPHLDLDETVERLRELIRIPSVNPPDGGPDVAAGRDPRGGETAAARHCAEVLAGAGIETEVIETVDGRGSCFARLRAEGPETEPPLILLSHLDVVPVDAAAWSRDPFGGDLVDGEIWGRGAVDMKNMVAMELGVMLALRRAGTDLLRDVIFAAVADEEAGGSFGAQALVRSHPHWFTDASARPAAAALNEVGGYSMTIRGRRHYTIQVAEKGIVWSRLRTTGIPGHGSMPDEANAAVRLAAAVSAIAQHMAGRAPRLTETVRRFLVALGLSEVAGLVDTDPATVSEALARHVDDPVVRRSLDAMLRDTVTPTVLRAGTKVNVVPDSGEAELDVRTLPGTDQATLVEELRGVVGRLATLEAVITLPAVEWPEDAAIVELMADALRRADPEAEPVAMMITPGTDAKALAELGIPCYGFAPLRLDPTVPFLSLFHGHDERVPVSALAFGLPVLAEVVARYASR